MTRSIAEAHDAAEALVDRWEIDDLFDGLFEDPAMSYVEHVVHELAHAVTLGIGLAPYLSARIASAAVLHRDKGRENEAVTFAVEQLALPRIVDLDAYAKEHGWRGDPREEWAGIVRDGLEMQIDEDSEAWDAYHGAVEDPDEIEDMVEEVVGLFWSEETKR